LSATRPRARIPLASLALAGALFGCDGIAVLGRGAEGCAPVTCEMACEHGFAEGEDGCEICACRDAPCLAPNPVGCATSGCPDGQVCETTAGCAPSSCACDTATASWVCTEDCGGGVCVPEPVVCALPDPSGCVQTGCPSGEVCDTTLGCYPSNCACDVSGAWICTEDCGGGQCVEDSPCGPSPAGCTQVGCPDGYTCDMSVGCLPSVCTCDPATGWACTDDCGGGTCVL
jgi:hypothetical protein